MRRALRALGRMLRPRNRPVILMYHRVAEPLCDPWDLSVSPRHFEEQMRLLRRRRLPLPLVEFVERLRRGTLPAEAVAVTFDDGYADNLLSAKPVLERYQVPATLFVVTGKIDEPREFWWDELARLVFFGRGGIDAEITIGGQRLRVALLPRPDAGAAFRSWRAADQPSNERERFFLETWHGLRNLAESERAEALRQLAGLTDAGPPQATDLPMTAYQLRRLTEGGLISIGAHTVSHPTLPAVCPRRRREEIYDSKRACENLMGAPIEGFSYPHGVNDVATQALVRDAGFRFACSTRGDKIASAETDLFDLPRLHCLDWNREEFERALC